MSTYSQIKRRQSLLLGIQIVLVGVVLMLGYHPSRGVNYIFLVSLLLGGGILVSVAYFWHQAQRLLREMSRVAGELELANQKVTQYEERAEAERHRQQAEARAETELRIAKKDAKEQIQGASVRELTEALFKTVGEKFQAVQGVYFEPDGATAYRAAVRYAFVSADEPLERFERGMTLPGQVAANGNVEFISDLPDDYSVIVSGLGRKKPKVVAIFPLRSRADNTDLGVLELGFFVDWKGRDRELLKSVVEEYSGRLEELRKREE